MESAVAVQAKGRAWGWYCATKVSIWRTKSFTWRNDPRRIARGATDVHGPSSSSFLPIDMKIRPVAEYIKLFIGRDTSRLRKKRTDPCPRSRRVLRCAKSPRSNVLPEYACARRFFARLASEIFSSSLQGEQAGRR